MSFDDRIREALERTTAGLRVQLERDLAAFSDELRRAAVEERDRSAAQVAEEVKRAVQAQVTDIRNAFQAQLDEARRAAQAEADEARQAAQVELDAVRRAADARVGELQRQTAQQLEDARRALEQRIADVQARAGVDVERARAEAAAARAELLKAQDERETARLEMELARTDAASAREDLETLEKARGEAETARLEGEKARVESEAARSDAATARAALDRTEAELAAVRTDLDRARADVAAAAAAAQHAAREAAERTVRSELADAAREADKRIQDTALLAEALRALDGTHGLGETLDVLADRAARHAERTAVLVVNGGRLRGRRLVGFPGQNPVPRVSVDLDAAGIAGAVVGHGAMVSRPHAEPASGAGGPGLPSFAGDAGARQAVALPLLVGGQVVAVLYADTPAGSSTSEWPAALEVLARHASLTLDAMTVRQATGLARPERHAGGGAGSGRQASGPAGQDAGDDDAARRYARLLVSEIRMYHEPVVDEGRRSRDLRARLGGEIDRARRLYEARVPPALRERSDYFEQELVRTLADGDRSLLG